jgi:beta-barrel assembly-enhancing protease
VAGPCLFLCLFLCLCLPYAAHAETILPDLGGVSASPLSAEQEYKLGRSWLRQVRGQVPILSDPLIQEYAESLVYRLASHSDLKEPDLAIIVINSKDINAFAVPGGVIGLNLGLFLNATNEDEVAAVVAHEIAHVSQHHFGRRLVESQRMNKAVLAAMLASLAVAIAGDAEAGMAGIMTSQAAAIHSQLAYSRNQEREADRVGMHTLVSAGMDPEAMASFFEILLRGQQLNSRPPEFLMTHPITEERIADARGRARALPTVLLHDSLHFQLIKARVTSGFLGSPENAVAHFRSQFKSGGDSLHQQTNAYGLAVSYLRNRQYDKAREILAKLSAHQPNEYWYRLGLAEIDQAEERHEDAMMRLRDLQKLMPGNYAVTVMLAYSQIKSGESKQAQALLRPLLHQRPSDAGLWRLAADAWGTEGDLAEAHLARGEYLFLNGRDDAALVQMRYALNNSKKSFPLHSRIKARLHEMEAQSKEEQ